ncbi:hypothetical protein [Chryseobacterium sp. ON_d1]|uniref:hypothetical protein n=1 Tax=Chryseobacterium sp. ON_d1 TaxID=2583211 RepID=UPI00115B0655|nr:hypothetical protein [Chryseobacterium sp. ON_d1]GEJ47337.1 hypothetical protein CRS_39450 [Chryseobacterium sp. ON_d1]
MKRIYFILLTFFPISFFSQTRYENNIDFIRKNCNQESLDKARKIYTELQAKQMDNSFDTTLKEYYEILESTGCRKFDTILFSAWEKDKVISKRVFETSFYGSNENYSIFMNGYLQKKEFRFANQENLDQGIDDELQLKMLKYIAAHSKSDLQKVIRVNIQKLSGQELIHFISAIEKGFELKEFQEDLISKSYHAEYAFDLNYLMTQLISLKADNSTLESILTDKKNIWDKENWSEKFWSLIRSNGFNIKPDPFYQIDDKGRKRYRVRAYISHLKQNKSIGENPLLFINYNLVEYKENALIEMLEKLDIKDIQIESKDESVNTFGARGTQGVLKIQTY